MEHTEILNTIKEVRESQQKIETLLLSQKPVLNFEELAEYSGFSKSFLYKLSMDSKIPGAYKPTGKQWFFERKEIDQWLLSNKPLTQ
jgi:excisionase family DNA binding protein